MVLAWSSIMAAICVDNSIHRNILSNINAKLTVGGETVRVKKNVDEREDEAWSWQWRRVFI